MKKKILTTILPIVGATAVVAPVATLTSCSKADFNMTEVWDETTLRSSKNVEVSSGRTYTINLALSKLAPNYFTEFKLTIIPINGSNLGAGFSTGDYKINDAEWVEGVNIGSEEWHQKGLTNIDTKRDKLQLRVTFDYDVATPVKLQFQALTGNK